MPESYDGSEYIFSKKDPSKRHYHGDVIRRLLFASAIIMLISLPLFSDLTSIPIMVSVVSILAVAVSAGLTSPRRKNVMVANLVISMLGVIIFEYETFMLKFTESDSAIFFLINQSLALMFLISLYYSIKSLRGIIRRERIVKGQVVDDEK